MSFFIFHFQKAIITFIQISLIFIQFHHYIKFLNTKFSPNIEIIQFFNIFIDCHHLSCYLLRIIPKFKNECKKKGIYWFYNFITKRIRTKFKSKKNQLKHYHLECLITDKNGQLNFINLINSAIPFIYTFINCQQAQILHKIMDIECPNYDQIINKQDFFPKIFLLPSEIKLDKSQGIKVIKRNSHQPDKFLEEHVNDITVDQQKIRSCQRFSEEQGPSRHGLLSLFKRTSTRRIKLAVCICVYNEPKFMLKNTIKGIQQSYKHFTQKAGILPHQIIIIVIFDGIQKMNNSSDQTQNMITFFNEIDIKNGFVKKPDSKFIDQLYEGFEGNMLSKLESKLNQQFTLFTGDEISNLQSRLFENQHKQYNRTKNLLQQIETLKKIKPITLDALPPEVFKKYQQICNRLCEENNLYYETPEQMIQIFQTKRNIKLKIIYQSIAEIENLCKLYLQSRKDKAILYPARFQTNDFIYHQKPNLSEQEPSSKYKQETTNNTSIKEIQKQFNYIFFTIKYSNQGKLSSHMLFFQGFCKLFDPQYCILMDVGTKPKRDAVYKMWQYMQLNPKCGGVCGYMNLKLQNDVDDYGYRNDGYNQNEFGFCTRFWNSILSVQRAQQFQYHFAHMLDKPFESAFSYIHVLPGAFSGYRWKALKNIEYGIQQKSDTATGLETERIFSESDKNRSSLLKINEDTILKKYLKVASQDRSQMSLQDNNMYLAEDRVLCLGIHSLGYNLSYLPDVESSVDPLTSLTRLMGQRRRWINGSWFAFNYVRKHYNESKSCLFYIQLLYYVLVQFLSWFSPALFYITMNLTLVAAIRDYITQTILVFFHKVQVYQLANYSIGIFNIRNVVQSIPDIISYIYILIVLSIVLYSTQVDNSNSKFKFIYYGASTALGIYGLLMFALLIYRAVQIFQNIRQEAINQKFIISIVYLRLLILVIIAGHAVPIILSFSFCKYIECLTAVISYVFYVPTYINILQAYAFARVNDFSWGTKGIQSNDELSDIHQQSNIKQWERKKYVFILQYVTSNIVLSYVVVKVCAFTYIRNIVILAAVCLVAFLLIFRLIPAILYLIFYRIKQLFWSKLDTRYINENLKNGYIILNVLKQIERKKKQLQKIQVKRKKEIQFMNIASITSGYFSKMNYGNQIKSKLTQYLANNSILIQNSQTEKHKIKKVKKVKKIKYPKQSRQGYILPQIKEYSYENQIPKNPHSISMIPHYKPRSQDVPKDNNDSNMSIQNSSVLNRKKENLQDYNRFKALAYMSHHR